MTSRGTSSKLRRGAAMMAVLACVAVTTVVLGALVKHAHAERKLAARRQLEEQARLLADAGMERAVWKLSQDAAYAGETWLLAAEQLGGKHAGSVTIAVEEGASDRRIAVTADYPPREPLRARRSLTRKLKVTSP